MALELRFAKAQTAEGAELVGIGHAAASLVGPSIYEQFVWPYQKKRVDDLHALGRGSGSTFVETPGRYSKA